MNTTETTLIRQLEFGLTTLNKTLAEALQTAVKASVNVPGAKGDWVDSHAVADAVAAHRATQGHLNSKQTLDYVQHLFREMYWSCRYATERYYFVHPHKECTPECRARRIPERYTSKPEPMREVCPSCFIERTITGTCTMGCDDDGG